LIPSLLIINHPRHPELVSGSIVPLVMPAPGEEWMLKQVQHDGWVDGGVTMENIGVTGTELA